MGININFYMNGVGVYFAVYYSEKYQLYYIAWEVTG